VLLLRLVLKFIGSIYGTKVRFKFTVHVHILSLMFQGYVLRLNFMVKD